MFQTSLTPVCGPRLAHRTPMHTREFAGIVSDAGLLLIKGVSGLPL